jgi:hypothetical protein
MAQGEKIKVRTFKRTEFIEVGRDTFDENVGKFFTAIGAENIIQILPLSYEHIDISTQKVVSDYGMMLVYKAKE